MRVSKTFYLDQPPERVIQVLTSEAFKVASESMRDEFVSTSFHVLEEREDRRVFEVRTVEYERSMTGALKRHKTYTSTNHNVWDGKARTLSWTYNGQLGKRASFTGVFHFHDNNPGTRLVHEIEAKVFIPLLGETIAGAVCRAFQKSFPDFERLLRQHLAASAGGC